MNFTDIYKKIRSIDEGSQMAPPSSPEMPIEECGMEEVRPMPHPAQPDNVDMNVTLHGSGPGGIRDLMSILRDLEGKDSNSNVSVDPHADDLEIMVGDMEEEYGNSAPDASGPQTASIQDVTNVGAPINGGDPRERQAGLPQGAPMQEALVSKLAQMYQEIKEAGEKKTMSRAAKGYEKYGKEGMQALAKAGKEGKDLDKVRDKYNKYD